ncbi:hypothetical protein JCM10213_001010 [Rhodosporidiobolus nylandii]
MSPHSGMVRSLTPHAKSRGQVSGEGGAAERKVAGENGGSARTRGSSAEAAEAKPYSLQPPPPASAASSSSSSSLNPLSADFFPSLASGTEKPTSTPRKPKRKEKIVLFSASSSSSSRSSSGPSSRLTARNGHGSTLEQNLRQKIAQLTSDLDAVSSERDRLRKERDVLSASKALLVVEMKRLKDEQTKTAIQRQQDQQRISKLEEKGRGWADEVAKLNDALNEQRLDDPPLMAGSTPANPSPPPPPAQAAPPTLALPPIPPYFRASSDSGLDISPNLPSDDPARRQQLEQLLQSEKDRSKALVQRVAALAEQKIDLEQQLAAQEESAMKAAGEAAKRISSLKLDVQARVIAHEKDQARVGAALRGADEVAKGLRDQLEKAKAEVETVKSKGEKLQQQNDHLTREVARVEAWKELYKKENVDLTFQCKTLTDDLNDHQSKIDSLETSNASFYSLNTSLRDRVDALTAENEKLVAQLSRLTEQLSTLETHGEDLQEAMKTIDELVKEHEETVKAKERLTGQIKELERDLEHAAERLREEMSKREEPLLYSAVALPYRATAWTVRQSVNANLAVGKWALKKVVG